MFHMSLLSYEVFEMLSNVRFFVHILLLSCGLLATFNCTLRTEEEISQHTMSPHLHPMQECLSKGHVPNSPPKPHHSLWDVSSV